MKAIIKKKKKQKKENENLKINKTNDILKNKIEKKNENSFIFDGKLFKKHNKLSDYQKKEIFK